MYGGGNPPSSGFQQNPNLLLAAFQLQVQQMQQQLQHQQQQQQQQRPTLGFGGLPVSSALPGANLLSSYLQIPQQAQQRPPVPTATISASHLSMPVASVQQQQMQAQAPAVCLKLS